MIKTDHGLVPILFWLSFCTCISDKTPLAVSMETYVSWGSGIFRFVVKIHQEHTWILLLDNTGEQMAEVCACVCQAFCILQSSQGHST